MQELSIGSSRRLALHWHCLTPAHTSADPVTLSLATLTLYGSCLRRLAAHHRHTLDPLIAAFQVSEMPLHVARGASESQKAFGAHPTAVSCTARGGRQRHSQPPLSPSWCHLNRYLLHSQRRVMLQRGTSDQQQSAGSEGVQICRHCFICAQKACLYPLRLAYCLYPQVKHCLQNCAAPCRQTAVGCRCNITLRRLCSR
jgi:hypothetical protein